ncbi:MAG: HAD-IC family P-type ATPase [Fusobacteria bacterium]|nr:HAD-IC family P-type ATPase [Fusobacteriota bacterium]
MTKDFFISYIESDTILHRAIEDINLLPDVEKATYQSFQQKIKIIYKDNINEKALLRDIMDVIHNYDDKIKISERIVATEQKLNKLNVALFLTGILLYAISYSSIVPESIKWLLYIAAIILASKVLITKVYYTIKEKKLNESILVLLAIAGIIIIKDYQEAMFILVIYTIANHFVNKASQIAKNQVVETLHKDETLVYKLKDKVVLPTPIIKIKIGDTIVVRAGEIIPLQTKVLEGISNIDMSIISNENYQQEVKPGDVILSGCINLDKPLKLEVLKDYNEGIVKELITKTEEAMEQKQGFAKTSEKIGKVFIISTGILAGILIVTSFITDNPSQFIYKGLVLLAISCPWAMLLSTPIAYNYALTLAKKMEILIKDSGSIDALGKLKTLFFTKTGVLTTAQYAIKEIIPYKNTKEEHILKYAAIGELKSTHPIGKAIRQAEGSKFDTQKIESFEEIANKGTIASYGGKRIVVGTEDFLYENEIEVINDYQGMQVHVGVDGNYIGSISLEEEIKPEGIEVIEKLNQLKVTKVGVLTGERKQGAKEVLAPLKISNIYGELNIDDKVNKIKREKQRLKKGTVGYVGNTISDAVVMAASDVSLAFYKDNLDRVTEVADVVLLQEDLSLIHKSIELSKKTYRIIKQNIIASLLLKAIIIAYILIAEVSTGFIMISIVLDLLVAILTIINCFRIAGGLDGIKNLASDLIKSVTKK